MSNPRPTSPPTEKSAIVLTGCTGFLGSAILRRLLADGRIVIATVRPTSKYTRIQDLVGHPRLIFTDASPTSLGSAFRDHPVGTIIHTATEYGRGETPIASILDSNLILPIRLAELGIQHGVRGFINTDSFFNKPGGSYSNLLNYSLSKRTLLIWLEKLASQINVANVILEHLYGPFDSRTKFVEDMIRSIAVDRAESVRLTHGHQRRDFVYVDDVVDGFMKILLHMEGHAFNFKTFEVGCGHSIQIRDFVDSIARLSGSRTRLDFGAIDYRDDEIMNSRADIRNMLSIGWKPAVTHEEGIQQILKAYGITPA